MRISHRAAVIIMSAALVAGGSLAAVAATSSPSVPSAGTVYGCVTGPNRVFENTYTVEQNFINFLSANGGSCPSGGFVAVAGPGSGPSPSPSPTVTSTSAVCTAQLGGSCPASGAYLASGIPMSNGYDTYVANQNVGAEPGTTATLSASSPGSWTDVVNAQPYGYTGVQVFPDIQQLTNDWCGGGWGGCASPTDTPLASLSALAVNYSEQGPTDANSDYEWAPDIWLDNYPRDIMFWGDTHGRCNPGAYGSTILGTAVFDGQTWTVNRYGAAGAEIIFVLDSDPATPDSCAQQSSGTIDIAAGLSWLEANGIITGSTLVSQVNSGYEITSADNATFAVSSYSITATAS